VTEATASLPLAGLAVAGSDGRLLDFDDSFATMLQSGGVVARLGDDVRELVRAAAPETADDSDRGWHLEESASLRAGSVVYRLVAGPSACPDAVQAEGVPPFDTLDRVMHELADDHDDDLDSVRAAVSATLISVLRARRSNERRIRARKDEVEAQSTALAEVNSALLSLSTKDSLTGLLNRRAFDATSAEMWASALDRAVHLGVVLLDIDGFKAFNDSYGHIRGDECLRKVSSVLNATSRSVDIVARFGGEEFVVLVAGSDGEACGHAAERLRAAVEGLAEPHPNGGVVTVSGGYYSLVPTASTSITEIIDRADQALYVAKMRGRNRVEPWDASTPQGLES
jgi:diguanylate cyclase (GGDEF)-like protein